jgi:hypothetical protein
MHWLDSELFWYVPEGQAEHTVAPASEYSPGGQGVGCTEGSGHEKPSGHSEQELACESE